MNNGWSHELNEVFPDSFKWGAATASYQIEGAASIDGRGPSVWDLMCRWPGKVSRGHSGEVACDHYHRYAEDVRLAREVGAKAYRFSFSWSRVLPEGVGIANEKGLDFYDRLIDTMLAEGIEPFPTLFHWDYPYALYVRGGWLNPDSPKWFADYAKLMVDRFSDRVKNWFTLNEPSCFLGLGHVDGVHAPGVKLDMPEFFLATKHALMGHGMAGKVIRAHSKQLPHLSIAPVSSIAVPIDESPENIEAARQYSFGEATMARSYWHPRIYLDPIVDGVWPEDIERLLSTAPIKVSAEDLEAMHEKPDSLGLNYYSTVRVQAMPDGSTQILEHPPGHPRSGFDWFIDPEGLYWSVRFHHERYGLPAYITENGISGLDWVSEDGSVHDPQRIDYTAKHLKQLSRAHREGYPVLGYFHWSLLDNFEWAEGYRHRFGLIHVDYETMKRTIKDSGHWYRQVADSNGTHLFGPRGITDPVGVS
nr:beta-glucosidase [uncultured bacterium]